MRALLIAAILVGSVGSVAAEETIIHREGPGPAVAPARDTTVVRERERDCASQTVHRENGAGDSTTVKKSSCD